MPAKSISQGHECRKSLQQMATHVLGKLCCLLGVDTIAALMQSNACMCRQETVGGMALCCIGECERSTLARS